MSGDTERPELSWALLHELLRSPTGRPDAWRTAGTWMLETLERRLGEHWPTTVSEAGERRGAGFLVHATHHTVAFGDLLELALWLELLEQAPGYGVVRKVLRFDPRVDQILHCRIQLELAALALRAGMPCVLEPRIGDEPPADVAFDSPAGRLVLEARAVQATDRWRLESAQSDALLEGIHEIEARYGVSCQGRISEFLSESATAELYSAIEDRARLVAAGMQAPLLRLPGASLEVIPRSNEGGGRLTGPRIEGEAWRRIVSRLIEKTAGAARSGANWLRIDAMNGLWMFTQWALLLLPSKALELKKRATSSSPVLQGS